MAQLSGYHICSLVGRQGSGKSTYGKELAKRLDAAFVEASDVVKSIYGDLPRHEMPNTNRRTATEPTWLGDAIAATILDYHFMSTNNLVVLTGVREVEVHDTLTEKWNATVYVIHIYTDKFTRLNRLLSNGKVSTLAQFKEHDKAEERIGLDKVIATSTETVTSTVANPTLVVDSLLELVENIGAK